MKEITKRPRRPLQHLNAASKLYPEAWKLAEGFRDYRGTDMLEDWSDWCFLPLVCWHSIVREKEGARLSPGELLDAACLAALGAWRYTQSVYRLDSDLYSALIDTPPAGDIPAEVLFHMPEWSMYIETPERECFGDVLHGFFASLEWCKTVKGHQLRLLLDCEGGFVSVYLPIGDWTVQEALERFISDNERGSIARGLSSPADALRNSSAEISVLVSLVLYVCSDGVDYPDDQHRPKHPQAKQTKKYGKRLFPASHIRLWELGKKTGDQIRKAREQEADRKGPAPHIRRAHWHGFWSGPRTGKQEFNLKWLPPTVVASSE